MENNLVYYLIFLIMGVAETQGDGTACCSPGQALLRRRTNPQYCWDSKTNVTTFVPLTCNSTGYHYLPNESDYTIKSVGQFVILLKNWEVEYNPGSFCLGNVTTRKDTNLTKIRLAALLCYEEDYTVIDEEIYGWCMAVSAIFLLITAAIYAGLPELRDLQGKSIINFCISLAIGLGILAAMKLISYRDMDLCAARGFFAYFFIIASFFWTNAISVQILLSMSRPSVITYGWKKFTWYAIYAWGCSAVLTIAMAVVNFIPGEHLKPGIGLNHCWFFNSKMQWQYMYSVMTILIAINICIFLYTSILLWRHSFLSSDIKALRYKFLMTVRLFVVMGVAWIFEMIGTVVKSHIIWEILDLINSLQGVLLFLVLVVFRRRVIKMMLKHGWLDCVAGPVERCLAVGDDEEEVVGHTIGLSAVDDPIK